MQHGHTLFGLSLKTGLIFLQQPQNGDIAPIPRIVNGCVTLIIDVIDEMAGQDLDFTDGVVIHF